MSAFNYRIYQCLWAKSSLPAWWDDLDTPVDLDDHKSIDASYPIDDWLVQFCGQFGNVFGFASEQNGRLVQNLFPIKKNSTEQISSSSKATLEVHTETAFRDDRADLVALFCVRDDQEAGTTLASISSIVSQLDAETIALLHGDNFVIGVDESFLRGGEQNQIKTTPVLFNNSQSMTYDRILMSGTSDSSQKALDMFSQAIDAAKKTIYLKTGDILVFNNHTTVHGRTPFEAKYNGRDRWLKRAMIRTATKNRLAKMA